MRNIIIGTAGHIDHGKTALVRALTGIETDRLEEEKRRGISIDLGFAHLEPKPGLRLGFVDVPGHERFVRNMLAGASGIDLVLLVVAADESIKPQTREHFDICRLLDIPAGLVALTKPDLVDGDILDLVRLEVEEFTAGSFLENAPAVAVSSTTGEGIDTLRKALCEAAERIQTRDSSRYFRLPVDRGFTMKGFGAVVTGTLISGTVRREDEVEIHPAGAKVRVRGIQVHGEAQERAEAGQRTALNLAGVDPSQLRRGMMLTHGGLFRPVTVIDCRLQLLASAKPLKHRAPVHFHAGAAEMEAEVRLLDGSVALDPGAETYVRILLNEPAQLLPGDRFIIRKFSPVTTIGGGSVVDVEGPRYRRSDRPMERLRSLARGGPAERLAILAREQKFGLALQQAIARTGLLQTEARAALQSGRVVLLEGPQKWLADPEWLDSTLQKWKASLAAFHKANPLLPGMKKEDLRSQMFAEAPAFLFDAVLARESGIVAEGELLRLAGHRVTLQEDEERALSGLEEVFHKAGLEAPALSEALARSGVDPKRARNLLQILLRQGRLVKVNEDLVFHTEALAGLRETIAGHKGERFAVPVFKDWTGLSRKYAIPLLEYLDRERVTRRVGDERLVV